MSECRNADGLFVSPEPDLDTSLVEQEPSLGHHALKLLKEVHSERVILVDVDSGRRWTGGQLYEKIMNVATGLVDLYDFQQGSAACIRFDHSDTTCILALAIVCAGGIVACADPHDPYPELLAMSRKVDPKLLFCNRKIADWGLRLAQDLEHDVMTIVMGDDEEEEDDDGHEKASLSDDGCDMKPMHIEQLLNYDHRRAYSRRRLPVACRDVKRDVAFILMSSGTTGKPKAVPGTHWSCLVDSCHILINHARNPGRTINFAFSQYLNYVSSRLVLFAAIAKGCPAFVIKSFQPASYCQLIQDCKINSIYLGAAAFYNLISFPELHKYDLSSVASIFPMGAKIHYQRELAKFFNNHPNIKLCQQGYGSSEFGGATRNVMPPEVYLEQSNNCGHLEPSVKVKVVDVKTNKLLGKNEVGLLHLKAPTLFPGYYDISLVHKQGRKSPFIADSSVFDEDAFYITGDLGYFNDAGQLFLVGRQKEMMDCFGLKVLPQELEEIICQHPAVHKVCVMGIAHELNPTAQCPRAFIVPKLSYYEHKVLEFAGESLAKELQFAPLEHWGEHKLCRMETGRRRLLAEDIMKFVAKRASLEKLMGGIVLLDDIPVTGNSGKVNKAYLRSLKPDQIEIYGDGTRGL